MEGFDGTSESAGMGYRHWWVGHCVGGELLCHFEESVPDDATEGRLGAVVGPRFDAWTVAYVRPHRAYKADEGGRTYFAKSGFVFDAELLLILIERSDRS